VSSPRIVFLDEATDDLRSIEAYIAKHDGETRAAAVRSKFDQTMRRLAFMPGMGSRRPYLKPRQHAFPVPPWIIYCEALADGDGISIARIVDGRRDLPVIFGRKKR
jgi:plasmid stabilization system protein ParE